MSRRTLTLTLTGVVLTALIVWIASRAEWVDTPVPMPPRGEALTNPFYAAQRFAESLGAHTERDRVFAAPPTTSVIVLSNWKWSLSASRRQALEQWVEAGGRLVVDETVAGYKAEFQEWSGIGYGLHDAPKTETLIPIKNTDCGHVREEWNGTTVAALSDARFSLCGLDGSSFLESTRHVVWALRDNSGIQAMRVAVGRGSVTVVNASPWSERALFDGDNGWVLVAATGLHRGDDVHFLSEDAHPGLLALIWQNGAPVVMLTLAAIVLMLWRGGVRLGPLMPAPEAARRSLAEQITGTGQFALRQGGGESLHAAEVRALDEAGRRRVTAYAQLQPGARAAALARLIGFERNALAKAAQHRERNRQELRHDIALLEAARRRTYTEEPRLPHGTD